VNRKSRINLLRLGQLDQVVENESSDSLWRLDSFSTIPSGLPLVATNRTRALSGRNKSSLDFGVHPQRDAEECRLGLA